MGLFAGLSGAPPAEVLHFALAQMRRKHLDAVLKIEEVAFSNPWRRQDFEYALDKEGCHCHVAMAEGRVIGYSVGFLTQGEFHLADLAVRPDHQNQGVGRRFLKLILDAVVRGTAHAATLEVRVSNAAAIALYRGAGFRTIRIQKGYYSRPTEDALVMSRALLNWPLDCAQNP